MGLKKNNPGCNCCGVCLQEDSTEFAGVEVSGVPTWSIAVNGVSTSSIDPNAVYLWSSAYSHQGVGYGYGSSCVTLPSSWRLGDGITDPNCCVVRWKNEYTQDVDTGISIPCPCGTVPIYLRCDNILNLTVSISKTSVRYELRHTCTYGFTFAIGNCMTAIPGAPTTYECTNGATKYTFGARASIGTTGFFGASPPRGEFSVLSNNSGGLVVSSATDSKQAFVASGFFSVSLTPGGTTNYFTTTTGIDDTTSYTAQFELV
jgi:hypothetical protein